MTALGAPRRVLVTGARGYIGALVVERLAARAGALTKLVAADVRPVTPAERRADVEYLQLDVRDPSLAAVLSERGIETVVHLAAIVSPGPGSSPALEYSVDVEGTRNVLEACVSAGARHLIVTSSGAAYGYHADNPPALSEDCPLRGNDEFPYAKHKRLVEEMLADYRRTHPELGQLVFRPGTILGASTSNQITNLFEKRVVLGLDGAATPFVFVWDQDVVECIVLGVVGEKTGIYNLAGHGVMTLREIAARLRKPYVSLPPAVVARALGLMSRLGLTRYGPEQVRFLQYRPVLANRRLEQEFGYRLRLTSREVFELYAEGRT